MGEYQLLYTAIGAIVFVTVIIGGRMFLVSNFTSADIESQITTRELNAVSLSYMVLDCLEQEGDAVQVKTLNDNKGKNICDLCDICGIIAEARVTDLEADAETEWKFEYSLVSTLPRNLWDKVKFWNAESDHKTHSIYLNIDYEDYSHMGRLDVDV